MLQSLPTVVLCFVIHLKVPSSLSQAEVSSIISKLLHYLYRSLLGIQSSTLEVPMKMKNLKRRLVIIINSSITSFQAFLCTVLQQRKKEECIEESRLIREEQDRAFAESLAIDQAKDRAKVPLRSCLEVCDTMFVFFCVQAKQARRQEV